MPTVLIKGRQVRLSPKHAIGKGGEADVYRWTSKLAVKIWKQPNHPDIAHSPAEQAAARQRLREHQDKMPAFPTGLPARIIAPQDLARDQKNRIVGYSMRMVPTAEALMSFGQRRFRQNVGVETTVEVFRDLAQTVEQLHRRGVIIGDFNDLNELVRGSSVYLIDADSFQFGNFLCRAYTAKFLDPLLCRDQLQLDRPHNKESDWYAFAVMLLQSLLFVGPYGGVYRPKQKANRCTQDQRPLRRITIFNPEVKFPKFGVPWAAMSDDLIDTFQGIFQRDQRGSFPTKQLEQARWTRCTTCDIDHAQRACPVCAAKAPVQHFVKEVHGNLTITTLLQTQHTVVRVSAHHGVQWILHQNTQRPQENNYFVREDGSRIVHAARGRGQRFRAGPGGQTAYSLQPGVMMIQTPGEPEPDTIMVDSTANHTAAFDANSAAVYFCSNGTLYRRPWDQTGWRAIGQVLQNQTRFWVGEQFGLGYYRAGEMVMAFVFDAQRQGINDQVELPELRGHLVGARAYFAGGLCWLLSRVKQGRTIQHHLSVVDDRGHVRASEVTDEHDGWLGGSIHGKVAVGNQLYSATDEGLIRVDLTQHGAEQVRSFPDTEPYCEEGCELLLSAGGIVVVRPKQILLLEMK
ncbi:hypothetical protein LCGC14_0709550 [marine sediment metagenome]|uniref:Protein kinase domain-containing protein n=1 Tax=marine sediment metagenome TaxID=412755 RepID=A0A0F9TN48_9ZZZZ